MNRTDRLYALREELRRAGERGRTAEQLAAHFEVRTRTVKRDVSALQAAGFPVWARPGRVGGYVVDASATLPPVALTASELSGLAAAIAAAGDGPFHASARTALVKLLDVLDPSTRRRATRLAERVWIESSLPANAGAWRVVEQSLAEGRVVRVAADGHEPVDADPIFVGRTRGTWYFVGWDRGAEHVRWWAQSDIRTARLLAELARDIPVSSVGAPPPTASPVLSPPEA